MKTVFLILALTSVAAISSCSRYAFTGANVTAVEQKRPPKLIMTFEFDSPSIATTTVAKSIMGDKYQVIEGPGKTRVVPQKQSVGRITLKR
jgi:hypothetical protein